MPSGTMYHEGIKKSPLIQRIPGVKKRSWRLQKNIVSGSFCYVYHVMCYTYLTTINENGNTYE